MSEYVPDYWTVIFLNGADPHYRVLAGWSGGYLYGDSWKLNSGITKVSDDGEYLLFSGASESLYRCHKEAYGLRGECVGVWNQLQTRFGDAVELLDESTDWKTRDWIIT